MRPSGLSARAYLRVLKPVRTVADLAGSEGNAVHVLAEALQCTGPGGRVASAPWFAGETKASRRAPASYAVQSKSNPSISRTPLRSNS